MNHYANDLLGRAQNILDDADRLYKKHYVGRPAPFNVFTALRSRSDEVNLHSRFLHALLNHREPDREENLDNLGDFLKRIVPEAKFDIGDAKVDREKNNIDLLITGRGITNRPENPPWAVVVENKIWSADQDKQLEKYYYRVSGSGIHEDNIHIFYLTPDGREASEYSAGKIKDKVKCISYKCHILRWLEACQRRAVNNPPLRESLAQYMEVVRDLTGQNIDVEYMVEYMEDLKELCLKEENLVLVSHLKKAQEEACIHLVVEMWKHIKKAMEEEFEGMGILEIGPDPRGICVLENGDMAEEKIKKAPRSNNIQRHGLYYPLRKKDVSSQSRPPSLAIEFESPELWYGIKCKREDFAEDFDAIKKKLNEESGHDKISQWGWWPWGRKALSDKLGIYDLKIGERPEQWLRLKNEKEVKQCAREIAKELKEIWKILPSDLKQDRE